MKKVITRKRFNIISLAIILVLLANLLIVKLVNKSLAGKSPERYDLSDEIGKIIGDESQNKNKPQGSLKNATLIQLESHIKVGKKDGKYSSYTDEVLSDISKIEPDLKYNVKAIFPVYKETTSSGVKYYTDTEGKEATVDELKERRESLKHTIIQYGGVIAYISKSGIKDGLNNTGKVCLNKDIITAAGDQAVVIIGWDDNFSKDNYPENCRPTTNGAFIVQSFDDKIYVSYEDIYIENNLRYIDSVEEYKNEKETKQEVVPETEPETVQETVEETVEETEPETNTETPSKPQTEQEENITPENKEPETETSSEEQTETPVENQEKNQDVTNNEPTQEEATANQVEPDIPTEVTKVETGTSDALEVDTSSIKDTPTETTKPVTKVASVETNKQDSKETEYVSNANLATSKLPKTGSNIETILIIAIIAVIFITIIFNTYRSVISSDEE